MSDSVDVLNALGVLTFLFLVILNIIRVWYKQRWKTKINNYKTRIAELEDELWLCKQIKK